MTNRAGHDRRAPAHPDPQRQQVPPLLEHIGPCQFGRRGAWITVQCPPEYDALMIEAGGIWEPSGRRWLLRLHRLAQVLRKLRRQTDPVFRHTPDIDQGKAMVQNKFPSPVTCSHCGDDNAERLPSLGDYSAYRCPICGVYRISGSHEALFDSGSRDPKKAHFRLDPDGYRWLGGG